MPDTLKIEEEIVMAIKRMKEASSDEAVREMMEHRQKALHDEATWKYIAEKRGWRKDSRRDLHKDTQRPGGRYGKGHGER